MKTKEVNQDKVYAKLIALSIIYAKEESCRRKFLKRISYSPAEITAVMDKVCDSGLRRWIESVIPVMQCRQRA